MLGDQEDYIDFIKECEENIKQIELIKQDTRERPPKGGKDWSNILLTLAKNQLILAEELAELRGVDLM